MGESEIDCPAREMESIWDVVAGWMDYRNVSGPEGLHKEAITEGDRYG